MKSTLKTIVISLLAFEARLVLLRFKPKIVVVTGSLGKTSNKDCIHTALSVKYKTRKSERSFNSDVGVPLTILNLQNAWNNPFLWLLNLVRGALAVIGIGKYPEWLVLEVGADKPGDLKKIFSWLSPNIVAVTRFPDVPVHVEHYDSPEALIAEESIPAYALPHDGLLILNRDDEKVRALREKTGKNVLTFGFTSLADVSAEQISITYKNKENDGKVPIGMKMKVDHKGNSVPFEIHGALGLQHIYPVLAACTVALSEDINLVDLSQAFTTHETPKGRMKILEGINGAVIIDDTYNSSPVAAEEALNTISNLEGCTRKIAILGDMKELGSFSDTEHLKVGEIAAKSVDMLITVGPLAKGIAEGARRTGMDEKRIAELKNAAEAREYVKLFVQEGDVILVKASQSIRLEKVVEALLAHPEQKGKLLVRQEKEWLRR